MDYAEQQALYNLHIAPAEYEQQPYYRMMEVLAAQSRDDRPMSARDFMHHMDMTPEQANQKI